jgi:hypothetical protein
MIAASNDAAIPTAGWYRRFITGRGSAAGAGDWDLPDSAHDLGPYYPGLHLRRSRNGGVAVLAGPADVLTNVHEGRNANHARR